MERIREMERWRDGERERRGCEEREREIDGRNNDSDRC